MIIIDKQRLRTLTTRKAHTMHQHIYEDIATITGVTERNIQGHVLEWIKAIKPWLLKHINDESFWNGLIDEQITGQVILPEPTEEERYQMVCEFDRATRPPF